MSKYGTIYKHTNIINNKCYIGYTTTTIEVRKQNGYSAYFKNAIEKYGWDNFETTILEDNVHINEIHEKEKYWIKKYNTVELGYNTTEGGEGRIGYVMPTETIDKIRLANLGKKRSDEQRRKMSTAAKGRIPWNKGKRNCALHSIETKKKMSEAHLGISKSKVSIEKRTKTRKEIRDKYYRDYLLLELYKYNGRVRIKTKCTSCSTIRDVIKNQKTQFYLRRYCKICKVLDVEKNGKFSRILT